jgi:hypothetical protein
MKSIDQLDQAQTLLKIIHIISKQLAKHWFSNYQECNDAINLSNKDNSYALTDNDLATETYYFMKAFVKSSNKQMNSTSSMFLKYNQNCYLFKGIVNWLGYMGFQSIKPDLFDLVFLEWSIVRELDEAYFFSDSNVKYIYQVYDFPRLTESENILKIKTEIKVTMNKAYFI